MLNYLNSNNTFIVYGLGISGIATIKYLVQNTNNKIIASDDNLENLNKISKDLEYLEKEIKFVKPQDLNFNKNTIIINSPGIPIYNPPHPILLKAISNKSAIICDIELFYYINSNHNFIAVTGTNGKSTTVSLINHILLNLGIKSNLGGNIGKACFDLDISSLKKDYVLEISSYQIDLLKNAHFKISALTNITPDHIERYGNFDNYYKSKKKIFDQQKTGDVAIINIDDEFSFKLFNQLKQDKNHKSDLIPISTRNILDKGVSFISGILYNKILGNNNHYKINPQFLVGQHNNENIAIAFASVFCNLYKNHQEKINNQNLNSIIDSIENFTGLKHRMQFLGRINNIAFYNDSKATNADAAYHALKALDNIYWILGGRSKIGGIESLSPLFSKIKKAFLIGEASDEFAKILDRYNVNYEKSFTLDNATKKAFSDAKINNSDQKNILLSPACASFDQWQNFEQRGDYFCKIFDDIKKA